MEALILLNYGHPISSKSCSKIKVRFTWEKVKKSNVIYTKHIINVESFKCLKNDYRKFPFIQF